MAETKNFIIRGEHREALSLLSQEQKGDLLDAMFSYNLDREEPALEGMVGMAFAFLRNSFDSDREAYDRKCEQNKSNGRRGGRPRKILADGSGKETEIPEGFEEENGIPTGLNENPSVISETEGLIKKPKKANTKSNTNTNTNYNTPPTPLGGTGVSDSGFVDDSIKHWNSLPNLPPCRYLSVNLPEVGEVRSRIAVVGPEAAGKAMENLAKYWEFIEARYRPTSFHRFITRSLDNWLDDARPWERYEEPEKKETVSACAPAEDNFKPLSNEEWEEAGEGLLDLKQAVRRA